MPKPLTAEALEAIRAAWAPVKHEPWCSSVIVMGHRPEPCDCGREPDRDPHRDIATLLAEVERLQAENDELRLSADMACIEPDPRCSCSGCLAAKDHYASVEAGNG